ncbi:MAG TPA: M48 family metalloprotease, partial [Acidimicrobiales bacterium]|nr:M48 family metalloprotease [Acidimicrobiales bacterium]
MAVGAALVVQYYTNPEATESVLRHEVAHVVKRDVSKAYLAQSLWYSFLLAGLLPLLVLEVAVGTALEWESLWRLAALVILIYGARNSVLRVREYYADASAGASEHERFALAGVLERMPRGDRPVTRLLRVHPDPGSRVRALWDSGELFRPRLWDALAAGLLAGFAYPTLEFALFFAVPLD